MRSLVPLSLLFTILDATYAIKVPFEIRTGSTPSTQLARRSVNLPVANNGNAQYIGNVTLGGVNVRVLLDTGSSDLWVAFPQAQGQSTDLGKSVTLAYAVGQAAVLVEDTSTFSTDIHSQGYDGLFGLGPNKGSVIRKKMDKNIGDTTLTHIFQQQNNPSDSYITFLLDRKSDPSATFKGQLTISELASGFENITSTPKLDVDKVNRLLSSDQHWQAITDKNNGIIGPDGNAISVKSIVPGAPDHTYVAVFDSGFTFSQVPRDVSDAIYGRVQGAVYDEQNDIWTVPCGQYINISIQFGGNTFPVHPLDTVDDNFGWKDAQGNRVCIGAFQPITSAFSLLGHYDMILGMSFLRNSYTLLNFGSWAPGKSGEHPYIQLSSVTDVAQARQDFIKVRLGGVDTINDDKWALLPPDQMQHSPVSAEEKKKKYQELVLSRWPYILSGCLLFVILLVVFCIWRCCCRKGAKKASKKNTKNLFNTEPASTTYLPLQGPGGVPVKDAHSGISPTYHAHSQSQYSLDASPFQPHKNDPYATGHSQSQYSLNSDYPAEMQYPPGVQYPPDGRHSSQYQHPSDPPQYSSGNHHQPPPSPHYNGGFAR
ncbi:hypothetical protein DXG03_007681 [Asterophora parasitica]|uniref:Peptidase A1 domain-containing protein n=1 Tax=Asterophora parasitica TaxID=117018 RepID=A0A9P7KBP3_9AGAR|nr:hypothetical protein DXG03_007681 [Asterophora parasitica]